MMSVLRAALAAGRAALAAPVMMVAVVSLAIVVNGCSGTFVTYSDPERNPDDVAVLQGYYRYYVAYAEHVEIRSVDGKKPEGILQTASTAKLAPGKHCIEFDYCHLSCSEVCAFEDQFEAGQHYQLRAHSLADQESDASTRFARLMSIGMDVSGRASPASTRRVNIICGSSIPGVCLRRYPPLPPQDARSPDK